MELTCILKPEEIILKAREYTQNEENPFFRDQVETLIANNDMNELNDRFYTDLNFGTGGLRGVIGGGYNRMNPFTVQRATQGLANYINKTVGQGNGSAVIAFDSRNYSDLFALEAARVLCGNGIRTYLFTGLRPTPQLSFAVRKLGATAGIVVTASHNPSEYNGYKVYWSDGAQIVAPHDSAIIAEVRGVTGKPLVMDSETAVSRGILQMIDHEIDDQFIAMVKSCSIRPELLRKHGRDFKVVYTPLHGAGAIPVERALREMGIEVLFVPEQKEPDGNFSTVKYPNPEDVSTMKLALEMGNRLNADLVIGTDPDADRLAAASPLNGRFEMISGNQLGCLLADYIFSSRVERKNLPSHPVLIKTIVTTEMQRLIAESFGATCIDTLTGFKYIGEKIGQFESQTNGPSYVFGGEESYGYLVNTEARDKDAVSAAAIVVEMALYHRMAGRTLFDQLEILWKRFGYFQETQIAETFKGQSGLEIMRKLMERLRTDPPESIAEVAVVELRDLRDGTVRRFSGGKASREITLPSSDVLQFILEDHSIITARPSGTEPKIKFYASCRGLPGSPLEQSRKEVSQRLSAISEAIKALIAGA